MFKLLFKSSVSACFELDNKLIYHAQSEFKVKLNGKETDTVFNTNVFSLFDLCPSTDYTAEVNGFSLSFTTDSETCAVSVRDFGAKGDGTADDTRALQTAINCCAKNGRVYVPQGTYYTAPLMLKSNMTLELAKGARLLASVKTEDYPLLPGEVEGLAGGELQCATWEGEPRQCYQSFISAHHCQDIKIVGLGIIDGNGANGIWYINHKQQTIGRPRLVFLNNCQDITLHGITGCNSASWQMHPFFSQNISFYDIKIDAAKDSPNTDGCNPESCSDVNIIGVVFSVGDDCIAIKSGKIYMGAKYKKPSERITIRNCFMRFGHGGVVLGSEMAGGVKDLSVTRCLFYGTDRGLRIKTRRGRGKDAVIDNILFEDVKMQNVLTPLVINMFYHCDPDGKTQYVWSKERLPVDERTPYIGRFHFKNIECANYEYCAGFFYGLPEQPIKAVHLENILFSASKNAKSGLPAMMCHLRQFSREGLYFNNVESVKIQNVRFENIEGKEITAENTGKII